MALKLHAVADGKEAVLAIAGRFDFNVHEEFREALEKMRGGGYSRYTVDMGAVEDLDSSALGMLLLLRDTLGGDKADIQISRCRSEIREMLVMANFQELFRIS
jgi:anti-anti-sigma factor